MQIGVEVHVFQYTVFSIFVLFVTPLQTISSLILSACKPVQHDMMVCFVPNPARCLRDSPHPFSAIELSGAGQPVTAEDLGFWLVCVKGAHGIVCAHWDENKIRIQEFKHVYIYIGCVLMDCRCKYLHVQ